MHQLPSQWPALCVLVFLLGLGHGFDADHRAAIDGLTRINLRRGRAFAPQCGMLFSLGHGVVVLAIAVAVGISIVSLLTAAYGVTRLATPEVDGWSNAHEWMVGAVVTATVLLCYLIARRLTPEVALAERAK